MKRRIAARTVTAASLAALAAGGWLFLAPPELGGATRYAIVGGSSMEPALHAGDLVVVRERPDVRVGDAVLYRDRELGVDVLHRVVRDEDGRLVLKGDANEFIDAGRPLPSDVGGSLWFSIPRVGAVLAWVREPLHAALTAFALALFAFAGGRSGRRPLREPTAQP